MDWLDIGLYTSVARVVDGMVIRYGTDAMVYVPGNRPTIEAWINEAVKAHKAGLGALDG